MTEMLHSSPNNMMIRENKQNTPSEELHHISELLEELIHLLKDSSLLNKENTSDKPSPSDNEVMTVKEAAAILRISLPMMYEFVKSGRVHSIMVGRKILISRSSLMALIREGV